jgi:hypothetical protein
MKKERKLKEIEEIKGAIANPGNSDFFEHEKEEPKKRKAPLGLKIISVIYYIACALYLAIAIVAFIKISWISELSNLGLLPAMSQQTIMTFGIFFVLLSILSFFIARGLLKFQMWARVALLAICAINIFGGILSVLEKSYPSIINLVFNLIIACYILFSKKTKAAFSLKRESSFSSN